MLFFEIGQYISYFVDFHVVFNLFIAIDDYDFTIFSFLMFFLVFF